MNISTKLNFQVPGFRASGIACGLKANGKKDLALILCDTPAVAAGVFTKNRVQASSVILSRRTLKKAETIRAIVVNSGNANAWRGGAARYTDRLPGSMSRYAFEQRQSAALTATAPETSHDRSSCNNCRRRLYLGRAGNSGRTPVHFNG